MTYNPPKQLTITLTDVEKGNINGWVNYLVANPQYIGVPGKMEPGGPINVQTRIVLEDQSVERFIEIAKQFGVTWPPVETPVEPPAPPVEPPPPSPVVTLTPECPVELDIRDPFTQEERLNGQNVRVVQMWRNKVLVIPFKIPMPKNGVAFAGSDMVRFSICEFGSPPAYRQATLSKTPGFFGAQDYEGKLLYTDNSVVYSEGLTPDLTFFIKDGFAKPGETVYANVRLWMIDYDTGKGKTSVQENLLNEPQQSRLSIFWPHDGAI